MKIKSVLLLFAVVSFMATSCQNGGLGKKVSLKTDVDSTSYALGVLIAQQNKQSLDMVPGGDQINIDLLTAAFRQVLKGDSTQVSPAEANELVSGFFQKMAEKLAQENLEKGNEFLEKNKTREGIVVTESGLQYEIIKEGTGPKPTTEDVVKVHYHGTLIDGKVFDSSVDRGEPAEFPVGGVIQGWVEALQLMPVGSKWKIYLPASLAYGERGTGGGIDPNSVLIFEVELLEIVQDKNGE
ncbi:MAG: FKBP-type peptidyl-prolyl cis-trans isomerase [Prolixibacteraceae bacterium]|jgi:FKBP-type peptidyl-prolyl cis-trans isomerase|nr:FKBP-type peptidyl-prolyl cis-trans isomerase [Bacteroidota bacterium]NLT00479.1 FKBP-type peptidyl-prolyl cis-trans isomerase [Bacteroidales bacterium]OQB81011.1 MAG: FKBP-type 22 kDa peptidyl-prolyl cis-trans isomerase [Bacteroidetes bacterium ADurb.Bin123]HNZ68876.1 FKBP-type peptidyl-prolyl cis-trans isomerase [Prolixibacteraceae bacterium]HOC85823.1 FKBP-type peptidyl-prolyl cis-trans isomerase [Prolixibacteraceae bacterium]